MGKATESRKNCCGLSIGTLVLPIHPMGDKSVHGIGGDKLVVVCREIVP